MKGKGLISGIFMGMMLFSPGTYAKDQSNEQILARLKEIRKMELTSMDKGSREQIIREVKEYRKKVKKNPIIFLSSVGVLILILCYVILMSTGSIGN